MLTELRKVIPSFLQRVDLRRAGRGVVGLPGGHPGRHGPGRRAALARRRAGAGRGQPPEVTLVDFDPEGEDKVLAAICFPHTALSEAEALRRVRGLPADERSAIVQAYVGDRTNRRHRPGRAFERTDYRFEVVSDYGAFRDLQRHRMLTIEWQPLATALGYDVPEIVDEAGEAAAFGESIDRSRRAVRDPGRRTSRPRPPTPSRWPSASATSCR